MHDPNNPSDPNAPAAALVAKYQYDPYGNRINYDPNDPDDYDQPFRFSTKQFDAETGLSYFGHRYRDPKHGRWTSHDPIGERGGRNLYVYAAGSPTALVDALGKEDYHPESQIGAAPPESLCGKWKSDGAGVNMVRKEHAVFGTVRVWNPKGRKFLRPWREGCVESEHVSINVDYQIRTSTRKTICVAGECPVTGSEDEDAELISWVEYGWQWPNAEQARAGSLTPDLEQQFVTGVACRVLERCARTCKPACKCCCQKTGCVFSGDEKDAGQAGKKVQWRYGTVAAGFGSGGYYCNLLQAGQLFRVPGVKGQRVQPPPLSCTEADVPACEKSKPQECSLGAW